MKQKMKKCLCLVLSAVFVLSNCQLFTQQFGTAPGGEMVYNRDLQHVYTHIERPAVQRVAKVADVEVSTPVEEAIVEDMVNQLTQLRHDFEAMRHYLNRLFGDAKHAEIRGFVEQGYQEFLEKFEKSYIDFINEVNAYDSYVAAEMQKEPMERFAYKYTNRDPGVEHYAKSYAFEEGSVFNKMRNNVEYVVSMGPQGVNNRTTGIVTGIPGIEQIEEKVNAALSHVEERLNLADAQIHRITTNNEAARVRLTRFLEESGTTGADVVEYAMKTIPEHDLKFLGLVKATERGGVSKIKMALGYRKYLKAVGSRQAKSGLFNLMKKVSASSLHARAYRAGYENLLNDFPVLPKRGLNKVARLGRQALRVVPMAIIGTFLTATLITEVRSDNTFFADTIGPRAMAQIARKIDNGTASYGEEAAYFNSAWSDAKVEIDEDNPKKADPLYVAYAINLSLAAGKAYEDFDVIDKMFVEEEKSLALVDEVVNDQLQNQLDEQLATVTDRVSESVGMI